MAGAATVARRLGNLTLDLLFPPRCAGCDASGSFLCATCIASLEAASPPRCGRCWRPGVAHVCDHCLADPPAFDGMFAAYVYTGLARDLVHQLKYGGTTALAGAVAALLADRMGKHGIGADILVPVPLSGLRHRTRGYNQSEVLARRLAAELKLPLDVRTLRRRRHTPSQASSSDAGARHRNVQDAFETRGNGLAGRRVLLVDDVTTTGATLSACASAAKAGGAREVCAIAFARED